MRAGPGLGEQRAGQAEAGGCGRGEAWCATRRQIRSSAWPCRAGAGRPGMEPGTRAGEGWCVPDVAQVRRCHQHPSVPAEGPGDGSGGGGDTAGVRQPPTGGGATRPAGRGRSSRPVLVWSCPHRNPERTGRSPTRRHVPTTPQFPTRRPRPARVSATADGRPSALTLTAVPNADVKTNAQVADYELVVAIPQTATCTRRVVASVADWSGGARARLSLSD